MEKWLDKYLLPCPFKTLTGFDCPGCGFQRSVLALFRGDFGQSFHLYPATLPILLLSVFLLLRWKFTINHHKKIKKLLFGIAAATVVVSYAFKVSATYF